MLSKTAIVFAAASLALGVSRRYTGNGSNLEQGGEVRLSSGPVEVRTALPTAEPGGRSLLEAVPHHSRWLQQQRLSLPSLRIGVGFGRRPLLICRGDKHL